MWWIRPKARAFIPVLARLALFFGASVAGAAAFHPGSAVVDTNAVENLDRTLREALSAERAGSNVLRIGLVELDKKSRSLSLPAQVRLTNQVLEYALVTEQGKAYESLLTTEARAQDLQVALLLVALAPGSVSGPPGAAQTLLMTNAVNIEIQWSFGGPTNRVALTDLIQLTMGHPDPKAGTMPKGQWLFNGSTLSHSGFGAAMEGSLISLIRDPVAIINNPGADRDSDEIHFPNSKRVPPAGTRVLVILRPVVLK